MSKYSLIVRRRVGEDWSAWCNTDSYDVILRNIEVIKSYGWQYSLEAPMCPSIFITTCYAKGIKRQLAKDYSKQKTKFVTDDVELLKGGLK